VWSGLVPWYRHRERLQRVDPPSQAGGQDPLELDATPLLLTHGWPMRVVEYLDLIGPLTDPRSHGGDPATAFHLVIPSIPRLRLLRPDEGAGLEPLPDRPRVGRADC
jgi:hypothetical protein